MPGGKRATRLWVRLLVPVLALVLAGALRAQSPEVPSDGLVFADDKHRKWYARFWTGRCDDLGFLVCFPGSPNWNETTRRLVAAAASDRRADLRQRLLALGRLIGHEWAKENDVRRISTADLRAWNAELDKGGDADAALGHVEAEARQKLSRR
jgi:hypothetical protein